jgi:hypothetical protein
MILAKALLVLILFLFLLGLPGLNISRRVRKFAASLLFDSVFRPHRISRLNSYYRTGTVALLSILLFGTGIFVFSALSAVVFPVSLILLVMLYIVPLSLVTGQPGDRIKSLVTLMGPKLLILVVMLSFVAYRGPMFFWYMVWTSDLFRILFFTVFIALIFRRIQLNIIAVKRWSERNYSGAAGLVFMFMGIQLLIAGIVMHFTGLERCLALINDELLILPGGLSRILGITTHLGIPTGLPLWIIWFSSVLAVTGSIFFILNRKRVETLQRYRRG